MQPELVLVYEVVAHKRLREPGAADDEYVLARLLLEPGYLLGHIATYHGRPVPLGLV
jgi:hypothetical protein